MHIPDNHGLLVDADKLATELSKRGLDWADKDAAYRALEDTQKSVLSQAMLATNAGPVTMREAVARASIHYMEHLAALDQARHASNKARVSYDVYRIYVDLMRTNSSSQRALVNLT